MEHPEQRSKWRSIATYTLVWAALMFLLRNGLRFYRDPKQLSDPHLSAYLLFSALIWLLCGLPVGYMMWRYALRGRRSTSPGRRLRHAGRPLPQRTSRKR